MQPDCNGRSIRELPNSRTLFDIAPDGRFLGMYDADGPGLAARPREIAVVLNSFEELRALAAP
jgi:hypothetical protein